MIEFIDKTEIENRKKRKHEGTVEKDVSEFLESGRDVCVVGISRYKNSTSAYNAYYIGCKGTECGAIQRNGKLYLVRKQ